MTDEFRLIERIRALAPSCLEVEEGIGDDCAVLNPPAGERLLVTSDLLLEGVHFRRDWTCAADLGAKSVAVNLSDLAAMGARPLALVLGLGVPDDFAAGQLDALIAGFCRTAADYGVALVGGDTCRSQQFLTVAVTAFGTAAPGRIVRRSGARAGDCLLVSGELGDSALALRLLQRGENPPPEIAERHHRPRARVELGKRLAAAGIHAMIDLSDGLIGDLGHILAASGVGAEIETAKIPLSGAFRRALADDPGLFALALGGGEDYELLLAAEASGVAGLQALAAGIGVRLSVIGRVVDEPRAIWLVDADGERRRAEPAGFRHAIGK
ncbi:thiamine-phosphate kinase [Geothermobacter ehrlichii]|uniref:Thiamine-monophosphate kinase n=1 Tax=Geothermobacter ehrlichii TaxID=213224 RepID=A0A5D3WIY8_9BACT|nr:thiamine-phosphate kinase [Geothermobacter ehrlichii]TYO98145.1 thiamine-phosphate kinase [Geothermobacter ehrlichii]